MYFLLCPPSNPSLFLKQDLPHDYIYHCPWIDYAAFRFCFFVSYHTTDDTIAPQHSSTTTGLVRHCFAYSNNEARGLRRILGKVSYAQKLLRNAKHINGKEKSVHEIAFFCTRLSHWPIRTWSKDIYKKYPCMDTQKGIGLLLRNPFLVYW